MNCSSRADRFMVEFSLCGTIGFQGSQIGLGRRSVGCGEDVADSGCTLGTIVLSCE